MRFSMFMAVLAAFVTHASPGLAGPETTHGLTATATAASDPLTLPDLVKTAIAGNVLLRIDDARIRQAEALYSFAAAQAYPRGSLLGVFGGPTPETKTTSLNDISTITASSLEGDFDFGTLGFTMRVEGEAVQPLYTFGKITKGKEAASHVVKAAQHGRTVTQAEVAVNVNKAYWAYQLTRSFIASLTEGEKMLAKVLTKIEDLLDAESPQVTENDRLRLKFALATLAVRRTEAENAQEVALRALRLLLGWSQDRPLTIAPRDLDDLPSAVPEVASVVLLALEDRPELRGLREIVEAAGAFSELREARFWPDLFLGAFLKYAYMSNATNQTNPFIYDPYNLFSAGVGIGIRFELDIFTKLAELEQARAEVAVRSAQLSAASQFVELEVRKLHVEIRGGYARIEQLDRANRSARGWLTAATLGYDIGVGAADELIDAFLAWAASEAELQKTRFDTLVKFAEMARATGRLLNREE